MKILVLNNDVMERSVIQQVLQHNGHEIVDAGNTERAMQIIQNGGIRFVIVERNTTDMEERQFIKRIREIHSPNYIYILLIASRVQDTDITSPGSGADDYLHKPIVPLELKSRVHIGRRILGLDDNTVNTKGAPEKTAMLDPFTKILNETAFITLTGAELERARRTQTGFSLIALQINNFDDIKRGHGEDVGNDVLVLLAQSIREKSRPYDGTGRYKDDTFLIPLLGVASEDAEKIVNRILKGILNTDISLMDGTTVTIKLSAGIASTLRISASMEIEMLIEKAREAAARSRQNGDNRVYTILL